MKKYIALGIVAVSVVVAFAATAQAPAPAEKYLSPHAVAQSGKMLYVACATGQKVLVYDTGTAKLTQTITVAGNANGIAPLGSKLVVTCDAPKSVLCIVDLSTGKMTRTMPAGPGACSPVLTPDAKQVYVCNRFLNEVALMDLASGKTITRIPVKREPVAAALTPDGKSLVVANHLLDGRADVDVVAASVTIIDTASNKVASHIGLPNGSSSLRGLALSPDGKYAYISHILSRYSLPTTQLERGWMNTNAMSIVDVASRKLVNTVLLDDIDAGAANPWGVASSADGQYVCVTHAGTHELSVINVPALMAKLEKANPDDVPNDLAFLSEIRKRVRLKGNGPRGAAVIGENAYAVEYYSDSMSVVNLKEGMLKSSIGLGPKLALTERRKGEINFNDAALCFQGWQSCASCHPDSRVDGLNWDLLNDGIGNPKNTKSMLLSHRTPPVMSLGVRADAETAVRSGIRFIQFAVRPEEDAKAIDTYLKTMAPVPSPYLENGKLSAAAERGKKIFMDKKVGCSSCHPAGLFTDLKSYDVGTRGKLDGNISSFDTPTLVECWRTAPYMHDGSVATLREVLTTANKGDKHGKTSHLSPTQIDDLLAYVRSL